MMSSGERADVGDAQGPIEEAATIGEIRARILAMHALDTPYRTPQQIRDRIAELHHAVRAKEAA